jgi:hypothetical protein
MKCFKYMQWYRIYVHIVAIHTILLSFELLLQVQIRLMFHNFNNIQQILTKAICLFIYF